MDSLLKQKFSWVTSSIHHLCMDDSPKPHARPLPNPKPQNRLPIILLAMRTETCGSSLDSAPDGTCRSFPRPHQACWVPAGQQQHQACRLLTSRLLFLYSLKSASSFLKLPLLLHPCHHSLEWSLRHLWGGQLRYPFLVRFRIAARELLLKHIAS